MDLNTITELTPAGATAWRPGDAWLAGGTWLFSEPQPQLSRLLDLTAYGWPALTVHDDGLEIAATCTIAELSRFEAPADWAGAALIGPCCRALLGSFKVWNAATVGGNLALALPAGPMTSLTAALDGIAGIWAADGSVRALLVTELVVGPGRTALRPGELLRSVRLPAAALRCRTAFRRISLSPLGRSAALVIGRRSPVDGAVVVTVTASTVRPVRLGFAATPGAAEAVRALDDAGPEWFEDVHGALEWRRDLTRRYVAEVISELAERRS